VTADQRAALGSASAPICVACVGDRANPAGGPCLRCHGTGIDPDPAAPQGIPPAPLADALRALLALGARISPDLGGYASGRLGLSQVRCVLCGHAPCRCRQCQVPYLRWLATEPEPCGMTVIDGECPRGHRQDGAS
jgi:hypothetical protein